MYFSLMFLFEISLCPQGYILFILLIAVGHSIVCTCFIYLKNKQTCWAELQGITVFQYYSKIILKRTFLFTFLKEATKKADCCLRKRTFDCKTIIELSLRKSVPIYTPKRQ